MSDFTSSVYFLECNSVADSLAESAYELALESYDKEEIDEDVLREVISDNGLDHEAIDGHQYAIYYHYHLPILQYSSNSDYAVDNFGGEYLAETLKNDGLNGLHAMLAFYACYADVLEYLEEALEKRLELENNEG